MLLVAPALAADASDVFDCPEVVIPADAHRYAEPGEISSAAHDLIASWILDRYDTGCPSEPCDPDGTGACVYADDCTTAAGAHLTVSFDRTLDSWGTGWTETWVVTVEEADAVLTLEETEVHVDTWEPSQDATTRTWGATWTGEIDSTLPSAATVSAEASEGTSYNGGGYDSWSASEQLDSGACTWDLSRYGSGWTGGSEGESWRNLVIGSHVVEVPPSPLDPCEGATRTLTLDSVAWTVDFDTWEAASTDADGDEIQAWADCDDADPDRNACRSDDDCDGVDEDCDGLDLDLDADGFAPACAGGEDCDDDDPEAFPGGTEVWYDGVDQDGDGRDDDQDGDGVGVAADCDDLDPAVASDCDPAEPARGCGGHAGLLVLLPLLRRRDTSRPTRRPAPR